MEEVGGAAKGARDGQAGSGFCHSSAATRSARPHSRSADRGLGKSETGARGSWRIESSHTTPRPKGRQSRAERALLSPRLRELEVIAAPTDNDRSPLFDHSSRRRATASASSTPGYHTQSKAGRGGGTPTSRPSAISLTASRQLDKSCRTKPAGRSGGTRALVLLLLGGEEVSAPY